MIPYLFEPTAGDMKTCFKCHSDKPRSEFYVHRRMSQGTLNKCKECTKADARCQHRKNMANPQWVASERQRQRIKSRARHAAGKASPDQAAKSRWCKRNPHKVRAQHKARMAVGRGIIAKQPCEVCGSANVQAHHDDYSQPLNVRWLCSRHHAEHHITERLKELGVAV